MPSVGGKTTSGPPSPIRGSSRTERGSSRASSGGSSRSGNGRGEGVQFNSNQSSGRGPKPVQPARFLRSFLAYCAISHQCAGNRLVWPRRNTSA
jgi:hypothetical protein